jgi:histidyl-tRNA synthetase
VTPVFEHAEVFDRLGESTDVISKEMYEFTDRGDRRLALRPEGTAPVVRAYVQHKKHGPWKVWYLAPLFRYERPQKGRYRQHWQLGIETLGLDDPDVDVEVIAFGTAPPGAGCASKARTSSSTRWAIAEQSRVRRRPS